MVYAICVCDMVYGVCDMVYGISYLSYTPYLSHTHLAWISEGRKVNHQHTQQCTPDGNCGEWAMGEVDGVDGVMGWMGE